MAVNTTIHMIRHAHTSYNAEKRYAGTIDVPLSETGLHDASKAAAKLAGVTFTVVVSSTLKRSNETARIIVDNTVPRV